jgi:hypothetical protein
MVERGTVCLGPGVVEGPFPAGRVSYNIRLQRVSRRALCDQMDLTGCGWEVSETRREGCLWRRLEGEA